MASRFHQGLFKPIYPGKYKGNSRLIVYRSSWELSLMRKLDVDSRVLEWSSEETIVPYRDPVSGRKRRYFPDFVVTKLDQDGEKRTYMIEVKPWAQTKIPKRGKTKSNRRFMTEAFEYAKNQAKWEAAERYCEAKGLIWTVVTERELFNWGGLSARRATV